MLVKPDLLYAPIHGFYGSSPPLNREPPSLRHTSTVGVVQPKDRRRRYNTSSGSRANSLCKILQSRPFVGRLWFVFGLTWFAVN